MTTTKLTREQAVELFPTLPSAVRAQASIAGLQGPEGLGRYVRAACEVGAESGLAVTADGKVVTGKSGVSPVESGQHAAAVSDQAAAKALEKAVSAELSRDQRHRAVAMAVYDSGYELDVAVEPGTEAP